MAHKLKNNRAKLIVDKAIQGHYAIVAVCCYNLEGILATVRAAEAKRSPALIQLFPWSIEFADGLLLHAAAEAADKASVPIGVHMDHAQSPEIIRRAADLGGFDGIMVDMSHYERDENMRLSKELVAYCNARGIITECEPGRINGVEDGIQDTEGMEEILTTPEQAEEFVALGIDWLAPAFGNVHGVYGPKGPVLDFPRLTAIQKQVNVNGPVNAAYTRVGAELIGKAPLTTVMEEQTKAMQAVVEENMDWCKSSGKA
ncbi:fructose-bisphosphate aldolase class-II-domain-containing protein [Mycena sanguinolenta]|nr:fructose-bisphosphate aldolase class-II-domain-containing protein [Mycena sanguinolenta]